MYEIKVKVKKVVKKLMLRRYAPVFFDFRNYMCENLMLRCYTPFFFRFQKIYMRKIERYGVTPQCFLNSSQKCMFEN